jgi:glycosyltransferase involved in cell wall biosynthesis
MKVAFIIPALANKGPVLVVKDLVSGLAKRGVQCMVYYFDDIHEIEMDAPTEQIKFRKRIPFDNFDVVHSHGIRPDAYVFFHKPKPCSARCISTLHNYMKIDLAYQYNAVIAFFATKLWCFFLKKHDIIAVLSNDAKRYYQSWFPSKPVEVAYNSRKIEIENVEILFRENDILELKKTFSIIGVNALLTATKGIDQIIDALPFLPNHALVIVGNGKEETNLKQQALKNCVADRCLFLGYQKSAHRYLKFYDIFVVPSRAEGFSLTWLEAAQYKKNTVCSNIPVFQELLSNDDVTFFELNNISSLTNAIISAAHTDKGQHLFETYSKKYTQYNFVTSYQSVYFRDFSQNLIT